MGKSAKKSSKTLKDTTSLKKNKAGPGEVEVVVDNIDNDTYTKLLLLAKEQGRTVDEVASDIVKDVMRRLESGELDEKEFLKDIKESEKK